MTHERSPADIVREMANSMARHQCVLDDAEIAALKACASAFDQVARMTQGWQDIETAKRDGHTIIIGIAGKWSRAAYWTKAVNYGEGSLRPDEPEGWRWCGDGWHSNEVIRMEPTHWHLLPSPPRSAVDDKEMEST